MSRGNEGREFLVDCSVVPLYSRVILRNIYQDNKVTTVTQYPYKLKYHTRL